jgi:hypothetical protein
MDYVIAIAIILVSGYIIWGVKGTASTENPPVWGGGTSHDDTPNEEPKRNSKDTDLI